VIITFSVNHIVGFKFVMNVVTSLLEIST